MTWNARFVVSRSTIARLSIPMPSFLRDAYKGLSADVKAKRETFARYKKGAFRTQAKEILRKNEALYTYWKESCQIDPPQIDGADEAIANMESAASTA